MAVLSVLRLPLLVSRRGAGHGHGMPIRQSAFMWEKFKDMLHFYTLLGLIPSVCFATYMNLTIGPAVLSETPPGYEPAFWEYERHPVTRFMARNFFFHPAEDYERKAHVLNKENEKMMMTRIESQVRNLMSIRNDYQAWYYKPYFAKTVRHMRDFYYRYGETMGIVNNTEVEDWNAQRSPIGTDDC